MYGGAAVLDSRSDVVPNTLYHEEIGYGDQRLIPDPETAAVVPWAEATARFICDSQFIGGEPLRATPRHVFRRQLERCHDLGYEPVLGFEPEFYLLHQDGSLLFSGYQIFNPVRNTYVPMITELVDHMNAFGIEIITANCEYAGSQWEINFRPGAGLAGPDNAFSFKNAVKQIAHNHGLNATFMSKPFADSAGSGCHAHVSLTGLDSGENVFGDDSDPQGMSDLCRQFMAGQLRHARGIYTLLAPTVNCMKRRRTHTFSPTNISWGPEDQNGAPSHQERLVRVAAHREPRPDRALQPVSRGRRDARGRPERHRGGARARAGGPSARRGGPVDGAAPDVGPRGPRRARIRPEARRRARPGFRNRVYHDAQVRTATIR